MRSLERWLRFAAEDTDDPRTYPTTYMWFGNDISAFLASDQTLPITTTCSTGKGTEITLPQSVDPSLLVAVAGTTFFGQKVSSTSSVSSPSAIPSSILGYLDTLPEVQEQFGGIPITSCAYLTSKPQACTVIVTSVSTSCFSGLGNSTRTSCTEKLVTATSTIVTDASSSAPYMTNGPVFAPRRSAAYLTYNTLPLSDDGEAAGFDKAPVDTPSTSIGTQSKETGSNNAVERLPSITQESPKDSKPTSIPGETSHVAEAQPAGALVSALVSLAAASQNAAKATKPGETTDNNPDGDAGHQQSASDGGIEQSETQSIENLLSALQGVASHAATS